MDPNLSTLSGGLLDRGVSAVPPPHQWLSQKDHQKKDQEADVQCDRGTPVGQTKGISPR